MVAGTVGPLDVVGIAKDGHIIYGVQNAAGAAWTGYDYCNGIFLDGDNDGTKEEYSYVSTITFPYQVGCFGNANTPATYAPECTTNYSLTSGSSGATSLILNFGVVLMATLLGFS